MANKKNYYAVRVGKTPGIYKTWAECQAATTGYPGADYKGFVTEEEALNYMNTGDSKAIVIDDSLQLEQANLQIEIDPAYDLKAYVDGSYSPELNRYSFGCVLITPAGDIINESGSNDDPESLLLNNIAGEMLGSMFAVQWALKNSYTSLSIYYDYEGIEKWATGEWKANKKLTKEYADFMKKEMEKLNILFFKVKGHSGDKYNEKADQLAKKALKDGKGIPIAKKGNFWFRVDNFPADDLEAVLDILISEYPDREITAEKKINQGGIQYKLSAEHIKEKVSVSLFEKSNKLVIQGRPLSMFSKLITIITEYIDIDEIPELFANAYKIDIPKSEIELQFETYLPNAKSKLPTKMKNTILQSIYNLRLTGDFFDPTFLAAPSVRVIDGHMRKVLVETGIISNAKHIKDYGYNMFTKEHGKFALQEGWAPDGTSQEMKKYIGNCYNFLHFNRHELSHWEDPTGLLGDTTKILSVQSAHDLIIRTCKVIDEYYSLI